MIGFYPLKRWFLPLFLLILINFSGFKPVLAQEPDGAALFNNNCRACHSVGDNVVLGPGLKGIETRRKMDWIIKWVHNSSEMIKSGDAYANEIFKKYNSSPMTAFPNLKDSEIVAIVDYVKAENAKAPVVVAAPAVSITDTKKDKGTNWLFFGVLVILIILFVALDQAKRALEKAINTKNGIPEPAPVTQQRAIKNWIRGNKKLIAVGLIFLFAVGSWKGWYALASVGINQDYQPAQPIQFSHKLHAGTNGINCVYCHSGAEKSRHANIPSANVCMNCHKYVTQGTVTGTTEIEKIYKALDYDPATKVYGTNTKPIQWVKVHNLPDLAYFNHAQHVSIGKIECQQCHGPVQEMDEVKQFSPLTMGWCIQCHKDTEVKMEGNGYYTELHRKLQTRYGPEAKLTVDKIGGLECARCHY